MRFYSLLFLLCFFQLSCDESLPPRNDPDDITDVLLTEVNPFTLQPAVDKNIIYDRARPRDGMVFGFRVLTTYDDPLEADLYLIANFTFTSIDQPYPPFTFSVIDTIPGTKLRLEPNKPKWFTFKWMFDVTEQQQTYKIWEVLSGIVDDKYRRFRFHVTGNVQFFRQIKPQSGGPYEFNLYVWN